MNRVKHCLYPKLFFACNVHFCFMLTTPLQEIAYEHIIQQNPPLSLHLALVDPAQVKIVLEPTHTFGISEKTSSIAKRTNATLAINGGFFDFGHTKYVDFFISCLDALGFAYARAYPVQLMKINDQWFSSLSPKTAAALGWDENGNVLMDTQQIVWRLVINHTSFPLRAINRPYASGPILYTSHYTQKTPIRKNSIEVIVENNTVIDYKSGGGTFVPANGFIYATNSYNTHDLMGGQHILGSKANLVKECIENACQRFESLKYVLGSIPLLIKDGMIQNTVYRSSSFYTKKHPRTAICILSNGLWLFLVVDGRQASSQGMSLPELARFLKKRACISALNLDGGGSSTMVMHNNIVNSPSGREWGLFSGMAAERAVANAIIILPKTTP